MTPITLHPRSLAVLLACGLGGCFTATIHVAPQPTMQIPAIRDAWHIGIFGVIELSDPVSLGVCPNGVSTIEEGEGILGALVGGYLGIEIMEVDVNCVAGAPPPPAGLPPGLTPVDQPPYEPPPPGEPPPGEPE